MISEEVCDYCKTQSVIYEDGVYQPILFRVCDHPDCISSAAHDLFETTAKHIDLR